MNLLHTSVNETDLIHKIVDEGAFAGMSAITHYHSSECVEVTFLYHHGEGGVNHKTVITMTPEIIDIWRYNENGAEIHHEYYFEDEDGIRGKIDINSREFAGDVDCTIISVIQRLFGINWKDDVEDISHETIERNLQRLKKMAQEVKDGTYRTFEQKIADLVNEIISNASDDDDWDDSDEIQESK